MTDTYCIDYDDYLADANEDDDDDEDDKGTDDVKQRRWWWFGHVFFQ